MARILEVSNHRIIRNDRTEFCCHSVGTWVTWANGIYIEADLCVEGPFDRPVAEKRLLMHETKWVLKPKIHGKV